ncbi:MAG: hypothetical protein QHH04_03035 [Methanolinea sp.]|nr:hypothetical protein [Methanolinea sp.]
MIQQDWIQENIWSGSDGIDRTFQDRMPSFSRLSYKGNPVTEATISVLHRELGGFFTGPDCRDLVKVRRR